VTEALERAPAAPMTPAPRSAIGELFHFRQLIAMLVVRELKVRYKRSVFGLLWTMLNPLLLMVVYAVVFTTIMPSAMHNFAIDTPQRRAREAMPTDVPKSDPFDWAAQLRAMIGIDAARDTGKARADMLVIVAANDHMVNPIPAVDFAARTGARVVQLEGDCGHVATGCESDKVRDAVREFLAAKK